MTHKDKSWLLLGGNLNNSDYVTCKKCHGNKLILNKFVYYMYQFGEDLFPAPYQICKECNMLGKTHKNKIKTNH